MDNKINPKTIILIITMPILLLIFISILFYVNLSKTVSLTGTVNYINKNYIIVKDNNSKTEYLIRTNTEDYKLKDILKLTLYKINNNSNPKESSIKKVEIITEEKTKETSIIEPTNNTEEEIINTFYELNNNLDDYKTDKTILEKIKTDFENIVDFMFYDKEINGKKFNDLSSNTKLKLLKISMSIDNKINKILPDYKETLDDKYKNIKSKIVEKYLDITSEICLNQEETCAEAKNGLKELKDNFYISWTYIKNISGVGKDKLKNWYEVWRES